MFLLFLFAFVILGAIGGISFFLIVVSQGGARRDRRLKNLPAIRPSLKPEEFKKEMLAEGYDAGVIELLQKELAYYLSDYPDFGINPMDNADKDYQIPQENVKELAERLFAKKQGRRPVLTDWADWDQRSRNAPVGVLENMLRFAMKQ
ncbi:MAG: hypothetical protein QM669_14110 [Siphonobacter sp.]